MELLYLAKRMKAGYWVDDYFEYRLGYYTMVDLGLGFDTFVERKGAGRTSGILSLSLETRRQCPIMLKRRSAQDPSL